MDIKSHSRVTKSRMVMAKERFSKFLILFSVDGWSCVPPLLFTWDETMMKVVKIMVTSFKMSMHVL